MQNGYYQAVGGMVTQLNRLDVISHNLANVNTAGYKQKDVIVADFERVLKQTGDELPISNHTKQAASYLNRQIDRVPHISEHYTDFSAGGIRYTGNKLDLALKNSDLFFAVRGKDGHIKLTQNGAFTLDDDGYLVSKDGDRVLSKNYFANPQTDGVVLDGSADIVIDHDGSIYLDGAYASGLFVAQIDDVRKLQALGDNLYTIDDIAHLEPLDSPNALVQGALMSSNVNPINQMTSLIETHRLVEMYQKVMSTHMDELNNDAINKLASTK